MFDSFLAQCLVLSLLFVAGARVFFIKNPRVDAFAIIPAIALVIALLAIPIWGLTLQSLAVAALALLVMLTNLRALFRLTANLIVDNYSPAFIVGCVLELLLTLALGAGVVMLRPVRYTPQDFGAERTVQTLTGNAAHGFRPAETSVRLPGQEELTDYKNLKITDFLTADKGTGVLYTYTPAPPKPHAEPKFPRAPAQAPARTDESSADDARAENTEGTDGTTDSTDSTGLADSAGIPAAESGVTPSDAPAPGADEAPADNAPAAAENPADAPARPVIIFAGTAAGTAAQYEPYFLFLAKAGFTVLAADFYADDLPVYGNRMDARFVRRFHTVNLYLLHRPEFERAKETERAQFVQKYTALAELARARAGDGTRIYLVTDGAKIDDIYAAMDAMPGRVAGFFALDFLGEYKTRGFGFVEQTDCLVAHTFGLAHDGTFFIPRYLAGKTEASLKKIMQSQ